MAYSQQNSSYPDNAGFGTRLIHVGSEPDTLTGAVIPSISLSTTYKQVAPGVHKGFEYSRSDNPNRKALEALLASIEAGGAHAITFASGSAGTASLVQSLGPNSHVLSVNDVYGGTFRYLKRVAAEVQGLETTFLDLESASDEEVLAALRPNTKLIWVESPTNPTLRLIDIPRLARLARSHPSQPLILVDNTFLSPFYSSPLRTGADIVLHSMTKYINGHSDVVMGALIFPSSDNSARGQKLAALHDRVRFMQNAFGAVPSPHDAWLLQRGSKTLHLRMKQHGLNALELARVLHTSPYVQEVIYPGLKTSPRYELAKSVVLSSEGARVWIEDELGGIEKVERERGGVPFSGMVSFRIRSAGDGKDEAERFLSKLKIVALAESLGGVESLAEVPAEMTHKSIPDEAREALGIGQSLIRLSAGIEETKDLVRDVEEALEWAVVGWERQQSNGGSETDESGSDDSGERLTASSLRSSGSSSTSIESLTAANPTVKEA